MWQRLKQWARLLKRDVATLWFAGRHPQTPWSAKVVAALVVAYAFSPIDLIPDFIPVFGLLDDIILLPAGIWLTLKLLPEPVIAECRQQAQLWLDTHQSKPQNYLAAAIFVALWILAAWLIWRWLTH